MSAIQRLAETLNNARLYTPAELGVQIMKYVNAKEAAADLARLRAVEADVTALRDKWTREVKYADVSSLSHEHAVVYKVAMEAAIAELAAALQKGE